MKFSRVCVVVPLRFCVGQWRECVWPRVLCCVAQAHRLLVSFSRCKDTTTPRPTLYTYVALMRKCVLMQHLYARMQHLRANGLSERPEQRHHEHGNDERYDVKRQSDTHKIGKTVVAHTLHYQVGLVANGGAETGRGGHADGYEKGNGTYIHVLDRKSVV